MNVLFRTVVKICVKSAKETANRPSSKYSYQEKMPEAVKGLKLYKSTE